MDLKAWYRYIRYRYKAWYRYIDINIQNIFELVGIRIATVISVLKVKAMVQSYREVTTNYISFHELKFCELQF